MGGGVGHGVGVGVGGRVEDLARDGRSVTAGSEPGVRVSRKQIMKTGLQLFAWQGSGRVRPGSQQGLARQWPSCRPKRHFSEEIVAA